MWKEDTGGRWCVDHCMVSAGSCHPEPGGRMQVAEVIRWRQVVASEVRGHG